MDSIKDLKYFVERAENYINGVSKNDAVLDFLQKSESCSEILDLLCSDKRLPPSEKTIVFNALEKILIRIADDLKLYKSSGNKITCHLLQNNLGSIYYMLSQIKAHYIKTTLKLLTAMVSQGVHGAKEVIKHLNFENISTHTMNRRDSRDPQDVRTCFLQFITSFFLVDDRTVICQLIKIKGFLNRIFPGLPLDKASNIHLFLTVLEDKVVQNMSISKTKKIRLFNDYTLKYILKLYSWEGPGKIKTSEKKSQAENVCIMDASEEDITLVQDTSHHFMKALCCSYKYGIIFHDYTIGTSGKNYNHIITNLLLAIERPYAQERLRNLVASILHSCPDQLKYYLPSLKTSLFPRVSLNWFQAVEFLKQIISIQDPVQVVLKSEESKLLNKLALITTLLCMPSVMSVEFLTDALQANHPVIRYAVLDYIHVVLEKIRHVMKFCNSSLKNATFNQVEVSKVIHSLNEAIKKDLPSIPIVLQCWNKLVSFGLNPPEEKKDNEEYTTNAKDLPTITISKHFYKVLEVLEDLQNVPNSFPGSSIHTGTLLSGIKQYASAMSNYDYCCLQLQIIKLITSDKHARKALLEKHEDESPICLLLDAIHTTRDTNVLESVISLLKSFFSETGLFDSCEWEIDIWIKELRKISDDKYIVVIQTLELALKSLLEKPYHYTDMILESMTSASAEYRTNAYNLSTSLDAILKEKSLLNNEYQSMINDSSVHDELIFQQPFSPLIPAVFVNVVEIVEQNASTICEYLEAVSREVLHHQHCPQAFCLFLSRYVSCLSENFQNYISLWMPKSKMISTQGQKCKKRFHLEGERAFSELLQDAFTAVHFAKGSDDERKTVKAFKTLCKTVHSANIDELLSTVAQIMFYLKTEADEIEELNTSGTEFILYVDLLEVVISLCFKINVKCESNEEYDISTNEKLNFFISPKFLSVFKYILSHPVIFTWFLKIPENSLEEKILPEKLKNCSYYLSKFVFSLLNFNRLSDKIDTIEAQKLLQPFKQKALKYCKREIIYSDNDKREEDSFPLISILEPFLHFLTQEEVIKMLELLTASGIEQLQSIDPEFHITIQLLKKYLTENTSKHLISLSSRCFRLLFKAYTVFRNEDLKDALLQLIEELPVFCYSLNNDSIEWLLKNPTVQNITILNVLTDYCPSHLLTVKMFFKHNLDCLHDWPSCQIINMLNKCWHLKYNSSQEIENTVEETCTNLYWKTLKEMLSNLKESVIVNTAVDIAEVLNALLKHIDLSDILYIAEEIVSKSTTETASLQMLNTIIQFFGYLQKTGEKVKSFSPYIALLKMLMTWLTTILGEKVDNDLIILEYVNETLSVLQSTSSEDVAHFMGHDKIWIKFLKTALKQALRNNVIGSSILNFINSVYIKLQETPEKDSSSSSSMVFQMILGHSNFLNIMLEETAEFEHLKDAAVSLWITLASIETTICKVEHIPILLASYNATLKCIDQKLLYLMKVYEINGVSMFEFRPFVWGKAAVTHYSVIKHAGLNLWKEPKIEEILTLLESERLLETAIYFPLDIELEPVLPKEDMKDESYHHNGNSNFHIYDPRFFLPLFCHLLSPGLLVNCLKFIESKCLALAFASLGSPVPGLRAAGYCVLSRFYQQLEGSLFRNKKLWLTILDSIINSIEIPNARLPCILTNFLCRITEILLKPDHPLYCTMYKFLLRNPCLDLGNVPEFFKLFNSERADHKLHRIWILSLLAQGLRTSLDFHICEKKYIFNTLLPFYASSICNQESKVIILNIIHSAVKINTPARLLYKSGLLIWLHNIVINSNPDEQIIKHLCSILETLWQASLSPELLKTKKKKKINKLQTSLEKLNEEKKASNQNEKDHFYSDSFSSEILTVYLAILNKIGSVDIVTLQKYLKTFHSVLSVTNKNNTECSPHILKESYRLTTFQVSRLMQSWTSICEHTHLTDTFLKEINPHGNSLDLNPENVKKADNTVAYIECQECFVEIFMYWHPKWKDLSKDQYLQTITIIVKIMIFVFNVDKQDAAFYFKFTEWLHNNLLEDENQGLIKLLISSNENGRKCFGLFLSFAVHLVNIFQSAVLMENKTAYKITSNGPFSCQEECNNLIQALFYCSEILQLLGVYVQNTGSSMKPLHKSYQYILNRNFAHGEKPKIQVDKVDCVQILEKLQLLFEFWMKKPKPLLHKHFVKLKDKISTNTVL